jgi:hypothetical protein
VSPPDAELRVDGHPVSRLRARDLIIAPGERLVEATRSGYRAVSQEVSVTAGEHYRLDLALDPELKTDLPKLTTPPAAAVGQSAKGADGAERSGRRLKVSGLSVGALGIASLAVGVGLAALTSSLNNQVNHPVEGAHLDPSLIDRGRTAQMLEQTFFAIGGAAVATSTALLVVAHRLRRHSLASQPAVQSSMALGFSF